MKIGTRQFGGMVPRAEPHLLTEQQAQLAVNSKIWRGSLMPLGLRAIVVALAKPGTIRTIYRFGQDVDSDTQNWFHWTNDTDVTQGPIPDDPNERTFFTEKGQPPKVTDLSVALGGGGAYPTTSYLLGLPSPLLSAIGAAGGVGTTGSDPQTVTIAYTYVSGWGEEGMPSTASATLDISEGQQLTVSNMSGPPSGAYNVQTKRIYVSQTVGGVAVFKFWREVPAGTDTISGTLSFDALAETLEEPYLAPPPTDLFGLMAHPNGFMIGFSGKRVCRSEVNRPHGWPSVYQDPVRSPIVGGAMIGSIAVICTKRETYLGISSDPVAWQLSKIELEAPCVSKRSIVAASGSVLYASADGLVSVSSNGAAVNVTAQIFTPDQWQAMKPESIHAYEFKGAYLAFYDTGSTQGGFVLDAVQSEVYNLDFYATAGFADPRRNALFLAIGSNVLRFDPPTGARATLLWRSKKYLFDHPTSFHAARVIASQYPITLRAYADNVLVATKTITSKAIATLGGAYRAREFYFELETSTSTAITECLLAKDRMEFSQ